MTNEIPIQEKMVQRLVLDDLVITMDAFSPNAPSRPAKLSMGDPSELPLDHHHRRSKDRAAPIGGDAR